MALDWFAFNLEAYTGDTSHLTCEEHGAYLLLMLAYYRSEKPLPGTDRALAATCKLPMDRWLDCKPSLAPFFIQAEGVWRHARIEAEIITGHTRMEKFSKRARHAVEARWKNTRGIQQEDVKNDTLTLTKDSLSADLTMANGKVPGTTVAETVPPPDPVEEPERRPLTPIDPLYQPSAEVREAALVYTDASTLHIEHQKFILHYQAQGSLSEDWDASFGLWMLRFKQFAESRPARGKPRVVLNPEHDPTYEINWDWHLTRWLKNESSWSRRTAGPEPGQPGCKVPPEMFDKHGIDRMTGRKKQTEKT